MKKLLLAPALLCAIANANAQLALETFNSGIPSTWTMVKVDGNVPNSSYFNPTIVTALTTQAWMTFALKSATDLSPLTVSYFNTPAQADRWLISPSFMVSDPHMFLIWEDMAGDATVTDSMQVLVSTTAGTTPSAFSTTIYNDKATTTGGFGTKVVSLGAFNGQTITVAFRNNSVDKFYMAMDNVRTDVPAYATDISIDSIVFKNVVSASSTIPVKVYITNRSYSTITSAGLQYTVDGGAPVTQTFSGLNLAPYSTTVLSFSTSVTAPSVAGPHSLVATINTSNGAADPNAANNTKTWPFTIPTKTVTRAGLIEEFSSATCVPCAAFNATFDPLITGSVNNANEPASNFNVVKYQMNWPSPGTDASYNTPGLTRRIYYNVNSIPDHFTNGGAGGAGNQAEIDACKAVPATMDITGTYTVTKDSVIAQVTVTPYFTISGVNTSVRIALAEEHYTNPGATTTQKEYYHIMRMMLPDANGTVVSDWTSGTPKTFRYAAKFTIGGVAQGNTNFWGDPINSNMVVFVQNDGDGGTIYQSKSVPAQWPASIKDISTSVKDVTVYPNPATNLANVAFNLAQNAKVNVSVVDIAGKTILNVTDAQMTAGKQNVSINTSSIAAGTYFVKISMDNGALTQKLSIVK